MTRVKKIRYEYGVPIKRVCIDEIKKIIPCCIFLLSFLAAIIEKEKWELGESAINIGFLVLCAFICLDMPIIILIILAWFIVKRVKIKRLGKFIHLFYFCLSMSGIIFLISI